MSSEKPLSPTKLKRLYALVIILACAVIFLGVSNIMLRNDINKLTEQSVSSSMYLGEKTQELEALVDEYERIKTERTGLGLENDELNEKISALRDALTEMKTTNRLDAGQKAKLEQLTKSLKKDLSKKDNEIKLLTAKADSLSDYLKLTEKQKALLGDSVKKLVLSTNELRGKLDFAAVLKAEDIEVLGVKENGKTFDDQPFSIRKLATIKIKFMFGDNKAASRGNKEIFLRLISPSGNVISDEYNGGGTLTVFNGSEIKYTMKKVEYFDNTNQTVEFMLPKGFNFVPGEYIAEIFGEAYPIGDISFEVE